MKTKIFTFITASVMILTMLSIPGISAFAESQPTIGSLDAPQSVTVEVKEWEDGRPYFEVKWANPASILELVQYWDEHGEAPLEYQIDMKVGDGDWLYDRGESILGNSLHAGYDETAIFAVNRAAYDPINEGHLENVDIKSNIYSSRVRYAYLISNDEEEYYAYSPFSNTASIGTEAFYKDASDWATPELQKAYDIGLIPDILKGADMTKPITREEFAELAVMLHEKVTGKKSEPVSPNPFTDTTNPQILKAYNLGITSGTSQTAFSPKVLINREQCATMLFRAIKATYPQGDYSIAGVKDFPDQKNISPWANEATKYMNKIGVITGDAKGNFMPKATTPAQEAAGYGMATREQAIALSVRTHDKAPEIKASSADNSNPGANASETTSPNPDANASGKTANSSPIPADVRAKLPDGFPDIPIAADAEFDPYLGAILPSGDDYILIAYKSKQTLEALYYLYIDFLKDAKDFFVYKQDDGRLYTVNGVKDGWGIGVSVSLSMGNQVSIIVEIPEN